MLIWSRALSNLNGRRDPLGRWLTIRWTGHDGQGSCFSFKSRTVECFSRWPPSCRSTQPFGGFLVNFWVLVNWVCISARSLTKFMRLNTFAHSLARSVTHPSAFTPCKFTLFARSVVLNKRFVLLV